MPITDVLNYWNYSRQTEGVESFYDGVITTKLASRLLNKEANTNLIHKSCGRRLRCVRLETHPFYINLSFIYGLYNYKFDKLD